MKFHEILIKMKFCKSQLIRQDNLIAFQQKCMDLKKTGHRRATDRLAVYYQNKTGGNSHLPDLPKNNKRGDRSWQLLWDPAKSCVGLQASEMIRFR